MQQSCKAGGISPQSGMSAVKPVVSRAGQIGIQQVDQKPSEPQAQSGAGQQPVQTQDKRQHSRLHQDQQHPQKQMSASLQRTALGKAGPVYVNGHHGKAKLEHAISASYSNITQMLQAISDEPTASAVTSSENRRTLETKAVPAAVPAKPVPAAAPAKPVPAAVPAKPVPAQPVPAAVPAKPVPAAMPAKPVPAAVPAKQVPAAVPAAVPAKPLPAAVPAKPVPAAVPAKPVPAAVPAKPVPAAVPAKPVPAAVPAKPVPAAVPAKPVPAAVPAQPVPAAVPAQPVPELGASAASSLLPHPDCTVPKAPKPASAGQLAQHANGAAHPATSKHDSELSSLAKPATSAAAVSSVTNAALCLCCGKSILVTGAVLTALGGKWHPSCWKCASCQLLIEGSYNTDKAQNRPYHPQCYKEAFGERCTVCKKTFDSTYTTVKGMSFHNDCFKCTACSKPIDKSYRDDDKHPGFYHPYCYKEAFGERCTVCKKTFDSTYTTVKGMSFHNDCFKCTACSKPIDKSYRDDDEHPGFYHPYCYKEAFGKRCTVCKQTFDSTYTTVKGKSFHYDCFRCAACSKPIDNTYQDDEEHPGFYHPHCYKEAFGKRCTVCNKTLEGEYSVVEGKCYHNDCFKCAACGKTVQGSHKQQEGKFYHPPCYREKFDPRCDVCTQLLPMVNGCIEWSSSYFWKQKYCRSHSSDGTPHCCSCNKLRPVGTKWLTLSDKRMVCHDCSTTVVHDSAQAQPLLDEVVAFFAEQGMALRVRPPLLLVDGPTLEAEHGEDYGDEIDDDVATREKKGSGDEAPVFHITGLCKSKSWGRVNHVVATQKGYSSLHKQPSLDATLRPADLSARNVEVTAVLVMYGLPRLLTGSILAHECMHAWFVLNYIDCSNKTVNEGLSQLMALIWVEAQKTQGNWQDRLASYYGNQIRTHPSPVYGGGLQAALAVFQQYGLRKVLLHVKKFGVLPAEQVSTNAGDLQKRAIKDALERPKP